MRIHLNDEIRMTNDELIRMTKPERGRRLSHAEFVIRASTFRASSFVSFVAERFDGVERGGFARWIKAEENANGSAEQERDRD
jgi:hypothetical protein